MPKTSKAAVPAEPKTSDYLLRNIPQEVLIPAKQRAIAESRSIKDVLLDALRFYGRVGTCSACHLPVAAHFDARNRKLPCDEVLKS